MDERPMNYFSSCFGFYFYYFIDVAAFYIRLEVKLNIWINQIYQSAKY
jgi:hypothetical protein